MFYCLVAFVLFFASLTTMTLANIYGDHTKFRSVINQLQFEKYMEIKRTRLNIFLIASSIGLITAILTAYLLPKRMSSNMSACLLAAIYFVVQYLIYNLYPKGPLMVTYLDTKEQREVWSDIYYHMKTLYISGGLLGVLAFFFFSKYICDCSK
jgi:uncharacterized membrane protein